MVHVILFGHFPSFLFVVYTRAVSEVSGVYVQLFFFLFLFFILLVVFFVCFVKLMFEVDQKFLPSDGNKKK